MKTSLLLVIFLISFCLKAQNNADFKTPDSKTYYYQGIEKTNQHTLTFWDSTQFHITVPNNSGSCFTWGEYGGNYEIKKDTVIFSFSILFPGKEVFIAKKNNTILENISMGGFMYRRYDFVRWYGK
jgi:hypothetical protein